MISQSDKVKLSTRLHNHFNSVAIEAMTANRSPVSLWWPVDIESRCVCRLLLNF